MLDHEAERHTLSRELQIGTEYIDAVKKLTKRGLPDQDNKDQNSTMGKYWTTVSASRDEVNLNNPMVTYYAPYFYTPSGKEVGLSHLFYVKLKDAEDIDLLKEQARRYSVTILRQNRFMPQWYTLAVDRNSEGNALEMANEFYESGYFSAAEPDLMKDVLLQSVDDPKFDDQWNLQNTGQYGGNTGSDIQALNAWEISRSHSDIVTAVLDHGLEMDHPDLPNIHPDSYDTETDSSPSQVRGRHGMPVGGITGAATDNSEGIAGIASEGQLMSISNSLSGTPDSRMSRADGINFAWNNGAHVINNSWSSSVHYQVIDDAIDNAVNQGRDGLGTVVVFASGNDDNDEISYPSDHEEVIAVGASSMCDERTSFTSCDTEDWGSNYGTGLDVVAPGTLIPTTDRQPPNGYNPNVPLHPASGGSLLDEDDDYENQDYTIWFNGTSAAAPHVWASPLWYSLSMTN